MALSILICEDEKISHSWLKRLLVSWGHNTSSAFTGKDSVAMAMEVRPDIILLDMLYPDMDGKDVLKQLRGFKELEETKIILVSATQPEELAPLIESFSVTAILQKPVKTSELQPLLEETKNKGEGKEQDEEKPIFMIIDRSGVHKKVVERMLTDLDCESLSVSTPESAVSLLKNVKATGILLDVSDDPRDVANILESITAATEEPIPLIVISTVIDQTLLKQLSRFGVSDILVKPVMTSRLRESVKKVMNQKNPEIQQEEVSLEKKSILIVEDFTITVNLMQRLLKNTNYRIVTASTASIAYDIIKRQPPSLMLLDLNLPGMSGMELAGKLLEEKIQIPFAVITAERDEKRLNLLRQLGALKIFKKPVNPEELLSFVKGLQSGGEEEAEEAACKYQVLLAMADETTAEFIEDALSDEQITFHTVTDGYLATSELVSKPPVAVIDMSLNDSSEEDLFQEFGNSSGSSQTMILTLAAELDDAREAELKQRGASAVIKKPFKMKQLIAQIRSLLSSIKQNVDVAEFADAFNEELEDLPDETSNDYLEKARRLGHNLAGTAGLVSSTELHAAGVAIEKAAKASDIEKCKAEIQKVYKIIDGFRGVTKDEQTENDPAADTPEPQASENSEEETAQ